MFVCLLFLVPFFLFSAFFPFSQYFLTSFFLFPFLFLLSTLFTIESLRILKTAASPCLAKLPTLCAERPFETIESLPGRCTRQLPVVHSSLQAGSPQGFGQMIQLGGWESCLLHLLRFLCSAFCVSCSTPAFKVPGLQSWGHTRCPRSPAAATTPL